MYNLQATTVALTVYALTKQLHIIISLRFIGTSASYSNWKEVSALKTNMD